MIPTKEQIEALRLIMSDDNGGRCTLAIEDMRQYIEAARRCHELEAKVDELEGELWEVRSRQE